MQFINWQKTLIRNDILMNDAVKKLKTKEELRAEKRKAFMEEILWQDADLELLPADASFRRYYRVTGGNKPALLMEDPPDRPKVPPLVMVRPFLNIANFLRGLGFSTPIIMAQDIENGLLLIEDFGDTTYNSLINSGFDEKKLYELAIDTLSELHKHPKRCEIPLPAHSEELLLDGAMRLIEWYYPYMNDDKKASNEFIEEYKETWIKLFKGFSPAQETIVLRDFHVDNLIYLEDREGIAACGLLDFQDASIGQFGYDVMSLLEDARREVSSDLQQEMQDRYIRNMPDNFNKQDFLYSYNILSAQRSSRLLGQFVRLSKRDGKDQYLKFLPYLKKLMNIALNREDMKPMKELFEKHNFKI